MRKIVNATLIMAFAASSLGSTFTFATEDGRPRDYTSQGIVADSSIVEEHEKIYNNLLSNILPEDTLGSIGSNENITVDPYDISPMSAYIGVYLKSMAPYTITTTADVTDAIAISDTFIPNAIGATLIEIAGFYPGMKNTVTIEQGRYSYEYDITIDDLPETRDVNPESELTFPVLDMSITDKSKLSSGLYFIPFTGNYFIAYDNNGDVRWYVPNGELEIWVSTRLNNGRFIAANGYSSNVVKEFDLMGRIHRVYNLANNSNHTVKETVRGNIILPTGYTDGNVRPSAPLDATQDDGVAIVDPNTGKEIFFYDFYEIVDPNRASLPDESSPTVSDWAHINKGTLDEGNQLLLASLRSQNAVVGIHHNPDTTHFDETNGDISFIIGTHTEWDLEKYGQYLLQPIDEDGNTIYDLENQSDIDAADKDFWMWGQHNVMVMAGSGGGVLDVVMYNNDTNTSYDASKWLLPQNNSSSAISYRIDTNNMTIEKIYDRAAELGFYSGVVGSVRTQENGNLVIINGSIVKDENGLVVDKNDQPHDPEQTNNVYGEVSLIEYDTVNEEAILTMTFKMATYPTQFLVEAGDTNFLSFESSKWSMYKKDKE